MKESIYFIRNYFNNLFDENINGVDDEIVEKYKLEDQERIDLIRRAACKHSIIESDFYKGLEHDYQKEFYLEHTMTIKMRELEITKDLSMSDDREDELTLIEEYTSMENFMYDEIKNIPYRAVQTVLERHYTIMNNRMVEIRTGCMKVPNFNSYESYGLKEIREYLDDPDRRYVEKRPKVKGKTLLLKLGSSRWYEDVTTDYCKRFTFDHIFDNVEHPFEYMIQYDYLAPFSPYKWESIFTLYNLLSNENECVVDKLLMEYDIICFSLGPAVELPTREVKKVIEYLIDFNERYSKVYIKDISGRGYNFYRELDLYEKIKDSKLDVFVKNREA